MIKTCPKPEKPEEQMSLLWDACYNHLPHQIELINAKLNVVLGLAGVAVALIAFVLALSKI